MRTPSKEYYENVYNGDNPLSFILHLPKPDFTELDKEAKEFEKWIVEEQKKDRQKILESVHR